RSRAGARRGESVNVERGQVQQLEQMLAAAICVSEQQLLFEFVVIYRRRSDRLLLDWSEWRDPVIEVLNQDMPLIVFHAGEQLRQHHRRIRLPVAVVAAV